MSWNTIYLLANYWAFVGWLMLAFAPRSPRILSFIMYAGVLLLCLLYLVLITGFLTGGHDLPVDLFPVTDLDHVDHHGAVVDRVDNPVDSLPYPIQIGAGQLLGAGRARIVGQAFDSRQDFPQIGFGDRLQILKHRILEQDLISCHRSSAF